MKRTLLVFLVILLFICSFSSVCFAQEEDTYELPSLDSVRSFAIYNIENDFYVASKNENLSVAPASTVKIMSGLLICEALSGKENETVTLTSEMLFGSTGKTFGLTATTRLTIKDLMIIAFSGGYNDAVNALACIVSGSTVEFVKRMNERCKILGMRSTHYENATGLDSPLMSTTLKDTLKVAAEASKIPLFLEVSSHFTYVVNFAGGGSKTVYGSNLLMDENSVYFCRSAKGMNSGMTDAGGACLVTYAEHKGAKYAVVAMGCPEDDTRFALVQDSLQYAYDNYSYHVYLEKGSGVGNFPVELSDVGTNALIVLDEDLTYFAKNGHTPNQMRVVLSFYGELKAPIKAGESVGYCTLWDGEELCCTVNVTVKTDVERSAFLAYMSSVRGYLGGRAFVASLVCAIVLTLVAIFLPRVALKMRQRKRKYVRSRGGFKLK